MKNKIQKPMAFKNILNLKESIAKWCDLKNILFIANNKLRILADTAKNS